MFPKAVVILIVYLQIGDAIYYTFDGSGTLDCGYANYGSVDIFVFFNQMWKGKAIIAVEKIKKTLASNNRFGVYVKMIQYNSTSPIYCPLGVDCQSNGFDTSYKRILRSMPMNEISYRSVYRVALIFIGQKNKKLDKIRTCNFKAVNDLQCLIIGINALEGGVEKVCDRILMDAFKSCWREQRRPGKFLEAFRKASYYGKEQIHSANCCAMACSETDLRWIDVFFLFEEDVHQYALSVIHKLMHSFIMWNRYETIIRIIQYNSKNISANHCRLINNCSRENIIESYERIANILPVNDNMYRTVGRIVVLIGGHGSSLPSNNTHFKQIIQQFNSSKDLAFLAISATESKFSYDDASKWNIPITKTAFQRCVGEIYENVKLSLEVVDESVGYDNKVELKCRLHHSKPLVVRPAFLQLFRDGVSVSNGTYNYFYSNDIHHNRGFIVDVVDGQTHRFTCQAHYIRGFHISVDSDIKIIGKPPKHIKENITKTVHVDDTLEVPCRDSKRMDADIYWTFNGSKISSDSHLLDAPFLIKIVTENNTGQYVCHAKNKVGEAVRVVNVQVIQPKSSTASKEAH